jgi:hypothetical protein
MCFLITHKNKLKGKIKNKNILLKIQKTIYEIIRVDLSNPRTRL